MTARPLLLQRAVQAAQLISAALGAFLSYDFGMAIGGLPMGLLMAANGAFFGTIMVGALADLIWRDRLTASSGRRGSSG